jgi:hypothetical protein
MTQALYARMNNKTIKKMEGSVRSLTTSSLHCTFTPCKQFQPTLSESLYSIEIKKQKNSNFYNKRRSILILENSVGMSRIPFVEKREFHLLPAGGLVLTPHCVFWALVIKILINCTQHFQTSLGTCFLTFGNTGVVLFLDPVEIQNHRSDFKPQLSHFIFEDPK